jgi:putative transcriptional regulator
MIDTDCKLGYNPPMNAERIKEIRKKHGLSKSGLARSLGATYVTVNLWESGRRSPSPVFTKLLTELEQLASED